MAKSNAKHEYTPSQALELLIERIERELPELATRIREIIDVGTVENVVERPSSRRKKKRSFMKARPFSDEEALRVAVDALQAYFVELPACIQSANVEFAQSAMGDAKQTFFEPKVKVSAVGEPKEIAIEMVPETAKFRQGAGDLVVIESADLMQLEEQRQNIRRLRELIVFD